MQRGRGAEGTVPFYNRASNHSVPQQSHAVGRRPAWEQYESEDAYPEGDFRSYRSSRSESGRNRRGVPSDGGYCDITSFRLQRHGRYNFGLSIQGSFVPPASHMTNSTPTGQPREGRGDVVFIDLDENSLFGESDGLGGIFSNGVHRISSEVQAPVPASSRNNGQNGDHGPVQDAALDANFDFALNFSPRPSINPINIAAERQNGHCEIAISDPSLNDFQDNLDDNFGMYLSDQGIDWPDSLETMQTTSSPGSKMHLSDEFNQDKSSSTFDISAPSLDIDPTDSPETRPNASSDGQDIRFFPITLDQNTLDDILNIDIPTLEMKFSHSLEMSPNPSSTQDASSSSNVFDQHFPNGVDTSGAEINLPDPFEPTPDVLSASQATSFSSNSNQSDFSTHPSTPNRPSPATTPSSAGSPGRYHSYNHYNSAFKRPSDRNRHAKVHFPGQRTFHCTHLGCERKGRKAFYRRDKLKDHEKQVHGFISPSSPPI